ncbi:MAG: DUF748 domain-containing protein [Gammaproteobacteria bacterium]|nr:DUF748 domain-containing protein [Gammaproteobacteria bacterium]
MGRYRRYLIGSAIVLVLVGAYAAAGFLAVPYFARKSAVDFVRTHYGRTLRLDEVHFNPFTLTLDVRRLALPDADGQTLLSFEHLRVSLQLASIWRLGASFGDILLEQPYVRAVLRADGEINFADLGKGFPPPKPAAQPAAPPRLYIQRLAVLGGTAVFEDHTRPTAFRTELKPIVFELRDFSTRAATGGYALEAASPEGERLVWDGTLQLAPFASRGVFTVSDLKATSVARYLGDLLPCEISAGTIALKGDYAIGGAGGPMDVVLDVRSTTVAGLGLRPRHGTENYLDLSRIAIDDIRIEVQKHAISIARIVLTGGDIKAWLDEAHRLNLLELLGTAPPGTGGTAAPAPPAPATPQRATTANAHPSPWTFAAPEVRADDFKLFAEDRSLSPAAALTLTPLGVHVSGFNISPDNTFEVAITAGVSPGGKIEAHAKVTPRSAAVDAQLEAHDLPLPLVQPYLTRYTSMTLVKGTLGTRLDIQRSADGALVIGGTTAIHDLRTIDNALKLDFMKWRDLRIADFRYRSAPASLRVDSVIALEPYVRMVIAPDRSTNIKEVLTPGHSAADRSAGAGAAPVAAATAQAASAAAGAPAAPGGAAARGGSTAKRKRDSGTPAPAASAAPLTPFPVSIGTVTLANGSANYSDLWIKPSFAIGIQSLEGRITGLSSDPQSRAKVQLAGKVDRYAPWKLSGEVNLLSAALFTDLTMGFSDVDLTVVNPYSGHFVGYRIDKGKLSVDVHYQVEQRKLTATQHFVVDQLELGERVESPDAVHVPLKIAVALLKDRNGVIDLNLPMSGSLDDPQFRIGPIVWKMFVNLITKVAAAPFALLGHLFGGGNEHLNIIEFDAGSAELQKPAQDQLASVAQALKERPQLKLDVPIVFVDSVDRPALAAAHLRGELQARELATREGRRHPDTAFDLALADPQRHFKLLLEQYQADFGKARPLPPSVVAVQQAKRGETPAYDAAVNDLEAALIDHVQVPDSDLQQLGKQRAQAIQGALVTSGGVETSRVFVVNASQQPPAGDNVKVELALK